MIIVVPVHLCPYTCARRSSIHPSIHPSIDCHHSALCAGLAFVLLVSHTRTPLRLTRFLFQHPYFFSLNTQNTHISTIGTLFKNPPEPSSLEQLQSRAGASTFPVSPPLTFPLRPSRPSPGPLPSGPAIPSLLPVHPAQEPTV